MCRIDIYVCFDYRCTKGSNVIDRSSECVTLYIAQQEDI